MQLDLCFLLLWVDSFSHIKRKVVVWIQEISDIDIQLILYVN